MVSTHRQLAIWAAGLMDEPWHIETGASLQALIEDTACPAPLQRVLQANLTWQFRCETSLRQVLVAPRLAPQLVAALLACGATAGALGEAQDAHEPLAAVLEAGDGGRIRLLAVPALDGMRWGEAHVGRAPAEEPIVAAWATVALDGPVVRQARVALTGVWDVPARLVRAVDLLVGNPMDEARIHAVAEAVEAEVAPMEDYLGSLEYRRAMARVLTRRALLGCHAVAGGSR